MNNAGIAYAMPIDWAPMSIFKRTADVNLWGVIEVTKTFLPLIKKVQGRVVNVSSVGGKDLFTLCPGDDQSSCRVYG